MSRLAPEIRACILALASEGHSPAAVARRIGCHPMTARKHLRAAGLFPTQPSQRTTPEERDEIVRLYAENGVHLAEISRRTGRSAPTIRRILAYAGLEKPSERPRPDFDRDGRVVRGFTRREDRALLIMSRRLDPAAVGRALGRLFPGRDRAGETVRRRLISLERRAESKLEAAAAPTPTQAAEVRR